MAISIVKLMYCQVITQTASKFCLHQWGMKPTLPDQCNPSNSKIWALTH
jgi:hypothetical protein